MSSPKASEFANYDNITITFKPGDKQQTHEFLVSKDGKQLVEMDKMDLTADPYQKAMAKIDLTGGLCVATKMPRSPWLSMTISSAHFARACTRSCFR